MGSWTVVVPVKLLDTAKTRLDRTDRAAVALAVASDTVAAAAACPVVEAVVVVTDDRRAAEALATVAEVIADEPARGLNPALAHGAEHTARRYPGTGVAALAADLPALRPDELTRALTAADAAGLALVADATGDGTVLLAAPPGQAFVPRFGPGSRAAHTAGGAVDLTDRLADSVQGLRRDVDTLADLDAAAALGVGPATRSLLEPSRSSAQATVLSWDATRAGGSAVTDTGTVIDLPDGSRLSGFRGLRPGQRVQIVRNGQETVVALITAPKS